MRRVAGQRQHREGDIAFAAPIDLGRVFQQIHVVAEEEFRVSVRRPDDLLVFDLVFGNLQLSGESPEQLVKKDPEALAYFVVEFPPQSFGEQAYFDEVQPTDIGEMPKDLAPNDAKKYQAVQAETIARPLPASKIRIAGLSRVAFDMPNDVAALPYTLLDVLAAFRTWPMRLD